MTNLVTPDGLRNDERVGGADPALAAAAQSPGGEPALTPFRMWSAIVLLLALQVTWSMDRSLPNLLVEPMRESFDLSDKQVGLVVGVAYGISFGVFGFLVGPLVDMFNRVRMLSFLVVVWSALTALCGVVTTYPQLLLARVGVGAGESGGTPASYAIIGDIVPVHQRATAVGIMKVGTPLGLVCATAIAGTIGVHYGWKAAFLVAGLPGIVLALLVLVVIPGARRKDRASTPPSRFNLREAVQFIRAGPGIPALMAGTILFMFANAGVGVFIMPLFQRVHHVPLQQMSLFYGLGTVISCVAPIISALATDRLGRDRTDRSLYLFMFICFMCFASSTVMALSPWFSVAVAAMMVQQFCAVGLSPAAFGVLLKLTPPQMRGTATGTLSALMYLLGIGPAPFITGAISDALGGGEMIRYAQVMMAALNCLCIVFFFFCARALARAGLAQSAAQQRA